VGNIGRDQALFGLPNTHLVQNDLPDSDKVVLPVRMREDLQLEKTNLLSRLVKFGAKSQSLGATPRFAKVMYGYIGLKDYTMYPLIRPGSFVPNRRKSTEGQIRNLAHGVRTPYLLSSSSMKATCVAGAN